MEESREAALRAYQKQLAKGEGLGGDKIVFGSEEEARSARPELFEEDDDRAVREPGEQAARVEDPAA